MSHLHAKDLEQFPPWQFVTLCFPQSVRWVYLMDRFSQPHDGAANRKVFRRQWIWTRLLGCDEKLPTWSLYCSILQKWKGYEYTSAATTIFAHFLCAMIVFIDWQAVCGKVLRGTDRIWWNIMKLCTSDITLRAPRPMEMLPSKRPPFQQVSLSHCRCFCLKRRCHPAADQRLQDFRLALADRVIQNRQDKEVLAKLVLLCSAWFSRKMDPWTHCCHCCRPKWHS